MKLKLNKLAIGLLIAGQSLFAAMPASASILDSVFGQKTYASTIEKLKDKKEITIGVRESSTPLSFLKDGNPYGYSYDLSLFIVAELAAKYGIKNIKINVETITPATRIPLIQTGKTDFECSSTTETADRRKQVNFSMPFYLAGVAPLYDKTVYPQGIRTPADMIGKDVVVVSGTTAQKVLENKNAMEGTRIELIKVKDNGEARLILEQKRASIFFQDDVLMAYEISKSSRKGDFAISKYAGQADSYGCMSKLEDKEFAKDINAALAKWAKTGAMEKSYAKWFTKPLAELNNLNLAWPMSAQTLNAVNELKAK